METMKRENIAIAALGVITMAALIYCNIENWQENDELVEIAYELRQYFHGLTNPDDSEWESQSFEQNQNLPISAY